MNRYQRIVAAIDLSDISRNVLDCAADLAEAVGAELDVIHVQPHRIPASATMPSALHAGALGPPADLVELDPQRQEALQSQLEEWIAPLRARIKVTAHAEIGGGLEDRLIDASKSADLIVLGAHQRSLVGDVLTGSVERKVTKGAACPVVLVPAEDGSPEPSRAKAARVDVAREGAA